MPIKAVFSGFGGQGVLMMGYSLAHSAMSKGYHVTFLPSYGAEVRGGTANCTVAIAEEEIASPVASEPDYLVAMNSPSLFTFQNKISSGGTFFLNSSIIKENPKRSDVVVFTIPCVDMAQEMGNGRVANIIMMGAFIRKTDIVTPEIYLKSLETILGSRKKSAAEINRRAFTAGYDFWEN
ncbi:MAG TPA: 2-oxoacid:acceptor oxidoreductase family protein [Smithellaceae bacterium]|jgi:2-oxoglutarate ferredoxin oxidoreductase subunit gamma|nr:2-oxoacid:acceptor oxidoreductase family protein [Syntrophaceae bacterium]MDX9815864.1 2-oxoacid:acceptor oxidoreductase family protein [Smithellaceae bacterium]MBP8609402.1 2-oxoacid:acceptor oxidoreductase family protein [Syntrophaceae bacterium]HNZ32249.1 2-oxoacid:acceptor oxidoreductase family protein [Smithellaceae bacterium]HOF78052.1 2-oxoacid:acceptor oxidoreductase family protein [Smithellaceae bacterium]